MPAFHPHVPVPVPAGATPVGPGSRQAVNSPTATCVLPDMSTRSQNGRPRRADDREDYATDTPARRHRWRPRRRGDRERAQLPPAAGAADALTMPGAMQLAIGLLTASLDSPELEAWAVWALIPEDPAALGDLIAGLHTVSQLLLDELQDATGRPPAATLQKLAILAETRRGNPSVG